MPAQTSFAPGQPCWLDLQTSDVDRARAFYPGVFGWTAADPSAEFGGYFMFLSDGVPVAGAMPSDEQAPVTDVWSVYLSVPDAAAVTAAATEHGGQVVVPPMPVADLGTMGFLLDPAGAAVGFWQPDQFPGFGRAAEPGAPCWFEVLTRDYQATLAFHRAVFGWTTAVMMESDPFAYSTMQDPAGGDPLAGVMDAAAVLPDGAPSHWSPYLGVTDTDAALDRVTAFGGSVLSPAEDTPYGRVALVSDATGAAFRIVSAGSDAG